MLLRTSAVELLTAVTALEGLRVRRLTPPDSVTETDKNCVTGGIAKSIDSLADSVTASQSSHRNIYL